MVSDSADSSADDDFDILDDRFLSNAIEESSPFNLDDVPSTVESDDPVPQEEVFHSMFIAREGQETTGRTWEQTPVCTLSLSTFEKVFRKKDKATAVNLLLRRANLRIDSHLTFAPDHHMLLWDASTHFLDFVLVVSGAIGLHAFLPNTISDHTFSVSLNFRLHNKQFKPKFGKLGFDPTGAMMPIGTGASCELWLGFCPLTHIEDPSLADETPLLNAKKHGETRLSARHYRMAVMFIASALAQISSMPIHIMHTYGTDEDFKQWTVKEVTNLYDQPTVDLRLEDLQALHRYIVSDWDEWVHNAPASWKNDGWLQSRVPLSIACRYGQNQAIASLDPTARGVEEANWQAERQYTNIRYMSVAIATDLTCKPVSRWEKIPEDELLEAHDVIYDSPNLSLRQPVNLEDFPSRDPDTQKENNIYDKNGRRIPRFDGLCSPNVKPCGVLINLETITELFSAMITEDDDMALDPDIVMDDDNFRIPRVNVYPQAFLRKYGHVQCNTVLPHFAPFISKIRNAVSRDTVSQDEFHDQASDDDLDYFNDFPNGLMPPVLLASGCQFYNEISHRIRPSAALHDVQQGRITSALSGAYAATRNAQTAHKMVLRECGLLLPHQRYDNKIDVNDIPRALRLENIYIFQLDSMKSTKRNGSSIYKDMVVPLASYWSHPTIFEAIRPHLFVLTAEAFPHVYQWTTYPITSLLERIWEHFLPVITKGGKPAPQVVEICSVLERALAYAHTGNAKVIATSLMRPLWLVKSLLEQGLPTFAPSVRFSNAPCIPVAISPADWPTITNMNVPAIASKRSQMLTYGNDHFEAYKAEFHIQLSVNQLASNTFKRYNSNVRHAAIIAVVALQVYIADVKTLVAGAVVAACNVIETEGAVDGQLHASQRRKGLRKWLATTHPLGYVDKGYEHLVSCILPESTAHHEGLPNPTKDKLSVHDFARLICEMSRGTDPVTIAAPLIFNGGSTPVFRIAMTYMRKYAPQDSPKSSERFLQEAFIIAANHLHINNIPWHRAAGSRGRRSRKPVFDSWVNLGKAIDLQGIERHHTQLGNAAADASQRAQATDTRAAWSAELITLQSLANYILRSRLPDEFAIESIELGSASSTAGSEPSLKTIYEWVFANFDINKPLHQIALIAGIYVSRILPDLFFADSDKPQGNVTNPIMLTKAIRALPWKPNHKGRKGCKLPSQFIAMVPAYIIAVYTPTSPLRIHLRSGNKSFPTVWNSKNSAKGIGSLLLVRLGLANALSHRIWKGGPPLVHWKLLSPEDLTVKHREISACLADRQYGPFRIAVILFGIDKAVSLGRTSQTYTINPAIASIKTDKHMSRADSEDEVEIVEVKTVKRARLY